MARVGLFVSAILLFTGLTTEAQTAAVPKWIWHEINADAPLPQGTESIYLRRSFEIPGKLESAELKIAADDRAEVFINGKPLGENPVSVRKKPKESGRSYRAEVYDIARLLVPGRNVIAAEASNRGGPFGFLMQLKIVTEDGDTLTIISDAASNSWRTAAVLPSKPADNWQTVDFDDSNWKPARAHAEEGDNPWFEVLTPPSIAEGDTLKLPEGFRAQVLRIAKPDEDTWVSMCVDDRGRLIVSSQHSPPGDWGGLLRFTLSPGDGSIAKEERINLPVGSAQGMDYGHGALYLNGEGPDGPGMYRVRDTDGDDQLDDIEFLKRLYNRGGSHGPHGVVIGPDGWIYHISGDYSKPVDDYDEENSPYRNFAEDLLLPRRWDATGHGRGVMAPCGHVQRFKPDGSEWQLFCGGLRNPYDLAFNKDGELFTYDADMEYDFGLPWYRPTRVYHLIPGGEYGHREGTGKWPYYYPDSLPPVTDIGLGSPCGIQFGYASHFPEKYKNALFMSDWAWGKVYAVHLEEDGATYTGDFEVFAEGKPLNAMDIEFAADGSMYLITGGNDSQAALYRISYEGEGRTAVEAPVFTTTRPKEMKRWQELIDADPPGLDEEGEKVFAGLPQEPMKFRRLLDHLPTTENPSGGRIDFLRRIGAWTRWDAFALRRLLESYPRDVVRKSTGRGISFPLGLRMLALARTGTPEDLKTILTNLDHLKLEQFGKTDLLNLLRVYQVAFSRHGAPDAETRTKLAAKFDALYPAKAETPADDRAGRPYQKSDSANGRDVRPARPRSSKNAQISTDIPGDDGFDFDLNRELSQLLVYLESPDVVPKTLALIEAAQKQEEEIWFIFVLRNVRSGWTLSQRKQYFAWYDHAASNYTGGVSFYKYLANFKADALGTLTTAERENAELAPYLADFEMPKPLGPAKPMEFVKAWTMADLEPHLGEVATGKGRNYTNGQRAFRNAQCGICHRIFNEGGAIGPDLSAVASRFSTRDILEAIVDPGKTIMAQYENTAITKKDGGEIIGRIIEESPESLILITDPINQTRVEIPKTEIAKQVVSKISPMPPALLNVLTKEEILDLLAYLKAGGSGGAAVFK